MGSSEEKLSETLKIRPSTKKRLDDLKIHPRQSYDEVIKEVIAKKLKLDTSKATEEFFNHIVRVMPPDWDCAELKHEGWLDKCPNLIKMLKNGKEKNILRGEINGCI